MVEPECPLEIYESGPLTVIGFFGKHVIQGVTALECRDKLAEIIQAHGTKTIAFDLTGVTMVPSGWLGLFAAIKRAGTDVLLFNPGPDIQEVLEITKLDTVLDVFEVDVD